MIKDAVQCFVHTNNYTFDPSIIDQRMWLIPCHINDHMNKRFWKADGVDGRFNCEYQGIENGLLMRANACASLRLTLWCLRPNGSKPLQYAAHVLLKPVAAAFDLVVNTALLVMKFVLGHGYFIGRMIHKIYNPNEVEFWRGYRNSLWNIVNQAAHVRDSFYFAFYQTLGGCIANLAGPKYDLFFRESSQFHWQYLIYPGANNLSTLSILDSGRVKFIKETCGWEPTSLEVPAINLHNTVYYRFGEGAPLVTINDND
jgi:hypothetical protein